MRLNKRKGKWRPWNRRMHPRKWMNKEGYKRFQTTQFKKGQTPWNNGKTGVYSSESLEKMSESKRGHIPWNKGRKIRTHPSNCKCNLCKIIRGELPPWNKGKHIQLPPETREKARKTLRLLWQNPTFRSRILKAREGKYAKSEAVRKKISQALKGRKHSETHQKHLLESLFKRPTKLEQKVLKVIEKYGLPFKYVGDGGVILGWKCPDFIDCDGSKRVVEVFGRVWHDPEVSFRKEIPYHQTEQGTIEHYSKYGFKCTVLWEDGLDNEELVLSKLRGGKD